MRRTYKLRPGTQELELLVLGFPYGVDSLAQLE